MHKEERMALNSRPKTDLVMPPQTVPRLERRPSDSVPHVDPVLLERIAAEFGEMRGFSPTLTQAARLFQVPPGECARVLDALVDRGLLQHLPDGTYRLV